MATSTERIPVLVTSEEKAMISRRAQDAHLSMGEFLRRALRRSTRMRTRKCSRG